MTVRAKILLAACAFGLAIGGNAVAASLKAATTIPPAGPTKLANPGGGELEDTYCKNGSSKFKPCNQDFLNACKKAGGTMSGEQGWGGRTCWEPS